jgi:hypothetical protein
MPRIDTLAPRAAEPAPTTSEALDIPLTLADLEVRLRAAAPGQMLEYHRGYLALDRGAGSRLGEDAGEELDQVALAVMEMAEAGRVHLIQRRHDRCDYSYIVVVARQGTRPGPYRPAWERR